MKILLIAGHGAGDPGAVGCGYKEFELTREVVNLVKTRLSKFADVDVYDMNKNAFAILNSGGRIDFKPYNYVLEIHFNAFNEKAHGTEIYVTTSEKTTGVEDKMVKNISALGFTNRGVKRKNFYLINTAKNQGVSSALLEVCFIDNISDMTIYASKKNNIADAIVSAIVDGFSLKKSTVTVTTPNYKEKVATRFGLSADTINYLAKYKYADSLFEKLATKK